MAYGHRFVVRHLTAELPVGITVCVGANGAGKSSLLRTIAGVRAPTEGTVTLIPVQGSTRPAVVGYLPQISESTALLTSVAYVEYFAYLSGCARKDVGRLANTALRRVGMLEQAHVRTSRLSGGMFRRVALAAAVVNEPDVVVLDEPTSGLDPVQRMRFQKMITTIFPKQVVIVATHLVDEVQALGQTVMILNSERMTFFGTVDQLGKGDPTYAQTGILTQAWIVRYLQEC